MNKEKNSDIKIQLKNPQHPPDKPSILSLDLDVGAKFVDTDENIEENAVS